MKEIKLTQGTVALVDDEDYERVNQFKWHISKGGSKTTFYAQHSIRKGIGKSCGFKAMHRVIMNTAEGMEVDHRDHNGLNNQRYNLRNCTHQQNQMNKTPIGKSKYLGVGYCNKYIQCHITINKKNIYLGTFKTEEDAAHKYDEVAKNIYGEFANLNFK